MCHEWGLTTLVRGDNYVASGPPQGLCKLQEALESKFEIGKTVHIGTHQGAAREGKALNRGIRRVESGWELEADMRHGELLVQQMGCDQSRKVTTPGTDAEKRADQDLQDEQLGDEETTMFRSQAARINYMSQDRLEILYSGKEVCKERCHRR